MDTIADRLSRLPRGAGLARPRPAPWMTEPVQDVQARPVGPERPATVPATPSPGAVERSVERSVELGVDTALRARLHQTLIARVDLAAVEQLGPAERRAALHRAVQQLIEEAALPVNAAERQQLVQDLQNEMLGLGPLEPLLADGGISEIMVNGPGTVYVERQGRIELTPVVFNDNAHLLKIIDKIVSRVGRRIDEATPMVDARLPDGSRINAVIAPIALDGASLSIRRFSAQPMRLPDLVGRGAMTADMAQLLAGLVQAQCNILISGGTGSGKTTLLNALSGCIPDHERIITIEDTAELRLQQRHVVRLETRPPNTEGRGEVTMRSLVKNSLRMRPDRVVLGEVRGGEVIDMLQAMNTGHDGSLTTVHANTPRDALSRLENLVGLGGLNLPVRALRQQIASAIHVVVQATRLPDGSRRLTSLHEVTGLEGDVITTQEIYRYERQGVAADGRVLGQFRATGVRPLLTSRLAAHGIHLPGHLFQPEGTGA